MYKLWCGSPQKRNPPPRCGFRWGHHPLLLTHLPNPTPPLTCPQTTPSSFSPPCRPPTYYPPTTPPTTNPRPRSDSQSPTHGIVIAWNSLWFKRPLEGNQWTAMWERERASHSSKCRWLFLATPGVKCATLHANIVQPTCTAIHKPPSWTFQFLPVTTRLAWFFSRFKLSEQRGHTF